MWRSVWPLLAVHFAAAVTLSLACALSLSPGQREARYLFTEAEIALYATTAAIWADQTALIAVWFVLTAEQLRFRLMIASVFYVVQWLTASLAIGSYDQLDAVAVVLGTMSGLTIPALAFGLLWRQVGKSRLTFVMHRSTSSLPPVQFGLRHVFVLMTGVCILLAATVRSRVLLAVFSLTCLFSALLFLPLGFLVALIVLVLMSAKEEQFLSGMGEGTLAAALVGGLGALLAVGLFSNLQGSIGWLFFIAAAWTVLAGTISYLRAAGLRVTSVFDSI
jgi:hypothetical protein